MLYDNKGFFARSMPRDDAHRRGRSVEVKPLHSRHSSYPNSMSASHKAFKAVVIPRMSSRQWIALGLGAFFALILLSQAIGPKSSPWRISDEAFTFPSQGVVARPNEDVSLDLSQVLVGPPTKHFRGMFRCQYQIEDAEGTYHRQPAKRDPLSHVLVVGRLQ